MARPRVLVFSWFYLPLIGGSELFVKALTERLGARYDFTVVTTRGRRSLPRLERRPEATIVRVGAGVGLDKFLYLAAAPLRALGLGRPDLVHAVIASGGAFAAAAYLRAARRPSLLTLQDGDSEEYVRRYLGPLFPFFAALHRRFDHVHAISAWLARRAIGYGVPPERVSVIPNGCDPQLLAETDPPEALEALRRRLGLEGARVIVSVSRLVLKNGLDRLLEAMPEVLRAEPSAALLLVGDGEDRARLERQAAQLGVAARVRFTGAAPPGEIGPYLRASELFVRPSLSEGLGSAFLEAMACGLPVIGTRVGGIPDFLEEGRTGLFCDPDRPATIATAILRLLEDQTLARTIGRAGHELVRSRYRWERVAEDVAALYDRLLGGAVAPGGAPRG